MVKISLIIGRHVIGLKLLGMILFDGLFYLGTFPFGHLFMYDCFLLALAQLLSQSVIDGYEFSNWIHVCYYGSISSDFLLSCVFLFVSPSICQLRAFLNSLWFLCSGIYLFGLSVWLLLIPYLAPDLFYFLCLWLVCYLCAFPHWFVSRIFFYYFGRFCCYLTMSKYLLSCPLFANIFRFIFMSGVS